MKYVNRFPTYFSVTDDKIPDSIEVFEISDEDEMLIADGSMTIEFTDDGMKFIQVERYEEVQLLDQDNNVIEQI